MVVLVPEIGVAAACAAVGRSRSTYYRQHRRSSYPSQLLSRKGCPVVAVDGSVAYKA
ncbi:hypothetical protein FDG2_3233 [Candidatus Protofrankia californiensis]|uniref:Uncharacterized protein n=1 Tax=Candidatus Protofrankia californiensis TaxID=1839754 RepID=A0A1C3NZ84_9ACTN|nr:hypothetical protein FDG2_3233 [Candidatus Protofrankia californiensis]